MRVMNEQVRHQQFGVGKVIEQTATTVTVEFNPQTGMKVFAYPSVFEAYLELSDVEKKAAMDEKNRLINEKKEADRKCREEDYARRVEAERCHAEERLAMQEAKRAAAKKPSTPRKTPAKPKKKAEPKVLAESNTVS